MRRRRRSIMANRIVDDDDIGYYLYVKEFLLLCWVGLVWLRIATAFGREPRLALRA